MKSFVKVCLVTALCCIVAGIGIIAAVQPMWPWKEKETSVNMGKREFSWKKTEDIKQMEVQIKAGTVTITEGDCFHVVVEPINDEEIACYVENQVLYILDHRDVSETVTIVPISIQPAEANITITVPKGFQPEKLSLELGVGEMQAGGLETEKLYVKTGAGNMVLEGLCAKQAVEFEIGTGEIHAYDFTGQNMTVKCGVGKLYLNGTLVGESNIECGIGEVVCELSGKEEAYSYTVACGLGDVIIGTPEHHVIKEHHGIGKNNKTGTGEDCFKVHCGIGSVKIFFEED